MTKRRSMPQARRQPIADEAIYTAIHYGGGLGHYNRDGHYATLAITGLGSRDEAVEWRQALYRSALWLTRHRGLEVSISRAEVVMKAPKDWKVVYRVTNKQHAIKYHLEAHGPDPAKWPYDPRPRSKR